MMGREKFEIIGEGMCMGRILEVRKRYFTGILLGL
jgi:hypothetical protein